MDQLQDQNPLARFVKDRLEPERAGDQVYVLNDTSVSPTREIATTEEGFMIEETIMTLAKSARFVDRAGNVTDVALRTGRVLSNEPGAAWYESYMVVELIRAGSLPLSHCPFTLAFGFVRKGPLVPKVDGKEGVDCGGHPEGCEHMKKVIDARRKVSHAKWQKDQHQLEQLSKDQVTAMMTGMAESFGAVAGTAIEKALAARGDVKDLRKNLRGEGEKG